LGQRRQETLDDRVLVDSTQRAVARGRQTILDARSRVLGFRTAAHADGSPETVKVNRRRLRHLVDRIDGIHCRLLQLSTSVEREIDSLDSVWAEIDWLTTSGRKPAGGK
jgi:hypothetical protein